VPAAVSYPLCVDVKIRDRLAHRLEHGDLVFDAFSYLAANNIPAIADWATHEPRITAGAIRQLKLERFGPHESRFPGWRPLWARQRDAAMKRAEIKIA
jgi:hypothetical protein